MTETIKWGTKKWDNWKVEDGDLKIYYRDDLVFKMSIPYDIISAYLKFVYDPIDKVKPI